MSKLSEADVEELLYLVHDKDHVGGSRADLRGLNNALRTLSTSAPVVYRGITSEELRHIRDSQNSFVPKGYTSATEDLTVAKKFADSYKTKTVLVMEGFRGFCYWRWLRDWFLDLKREDEDEYDSSDGDFMIESAKEESEWIFSRILFHVYHEENKRGFTYIHVRPGSATHAAMASIRSLLTASAWKDKTPEERRRYLEEHPLSAHNPRNLRLAHKISVYRDSHSARRDYHANRHAANPKGIHGLARDKYAASAEAFGRAHDAYVAGDVSRGDSLSRAAMKLGVASTKFASKHGILPPGTAKGPAANQKKSAHVRSEDAWHDYQDTLDMQKTADNLGVSHDSVKNALKRVPEYPRLAQQVKHVVMGRRPDDLHPAVEKKLAADPSFLGSKKRLSSTPDAVGKKKYSLRKRGHVIPDDETIRKIAPLLKSGSTVPQAARALGINKVSVTHYGKKYLGEGEFRRIARENLDAQHVKHGVATKNIVRPGTAGNRKFSGPTDARVWRGLKSKASALLAKETFEEKEHPRRSDGEFSPKNSGKSEPKKAPKFRSLAQAPEDREQWPEHVKALKLPPGWTDVRYSEDPHADLLALGKDKKGRDQYVYHEKFAKSQAAMKFARIHELDSKFDAIRDQVAKARRSKNPAVRDVADCVHLIMSTGLRPGSEEDTKADKRAYGASTLEGKHVVSSKGQVRLKFVGKKGVDVDVPVDDPEAVALLKRRAKEVGPDGQLFPKASASALLDFVHGLDGGSFKTKDMRTLKGTRTARELVSSMDAPKSEAEYRKAVMAVAKHVSSVLGNTPAVALAAYISPVVFSAWKGGEADHHREEAAVAKQPLPGVRFGKRGLPNWRAAKKTAGRDDDVPRPVDKSTKRMLGFDPHARARTEEHSAIQGRPNHHGDVHAELIKMLSAIKFWLHRKLGNDPSYLDRRDLDVNISQITGDHHYSSLMLKLTSNSDPQGAYALAKKIGALTYIIMFDCTGGKYAKWQPEFYESPIFTELLAHELTHQLQNLNDADHLLGARDVRSTIDLTAADYYNHPREVQAWTMGAVTRFTQHAKARSVDAFWEWAKKQDLYSGWMRNASPKSLEIARRIVSEVLAPK